MIVSFSKSMIRPLYTSLTSFSISESPTILYCCNHNPDYSS